MYSDRCVGAAAVSASACCRRATQGADRYCTFSLLLITFADPISSKNKAAANHGLIGEGQCTII